jgi:hypothetical protein
MHVPPYRKHISQRGKDFVICKNAKLNSIETVKKHSNKRSLPTCHHCGITGHIWPKYPHLQAQKLKVQRKLPTKATLGALPLTTHQAPRHQRQQQKFLFSNQSGKPKKSKSRHFKRKPQKPNSNHGYKELLSLMQGMLRRMDNMEKTHKPAPQVKQVWVRNDETIHPLKGSGLTK